MDYNFDIKFINIFKLKKKKIVSKCTPNFPIVFGLD